MITHYIKIFTRHFLKHKSFSLINVIGLSTGISCCLLIALYVRYELSYDNMQEKRDRMVRVIMEYSMGGNVNRCNYTSTKVGPAFKKNFPEVEDFVRMFSPPKIVRNGDKVFVENRFVYSDSTFFKLFSFPIQEGNPANALSGPNKVLLTRSSAKKYFGDANPIGKTIKVSSEGTDYMVTGILEDCPENSQVKFDFVASFSSLGVIQEETYWNANYTTYLLLKSKDAVPGLQKKVTPFMRQEMKADLAGNDYLDYFLEPFTRVHLYSPYPGFEINGNISYVYAISLVALLILAIACFTFVNLSTAKSVERAREIGIRKVAGAVKHHIFWQFIGESALITSLSAAISIYLSYLLLPYFNSLISRHLQVSDLFSLPAFVFCILIVLVISFFAGAYPSFVLSRFQPVKVLKGAFKNSDSGLWVRKSLFVFQFVVSVFLIICTLVMQQQLQFIRNKNLGFDRDHVITLPYDSKIHAVYAAFKNGLKQEAGILNVSQADFEPHNIMGGYSMKNDLASEKVIATYAGSVDEEYLKACGIRLLSGQDLIMQDIKDATHDSIEKNYFHFIINESAAHQLGWTAEEAVGKKMYLDASRPGIVKGVVEDFHFSSMHEPIQSLVLFPGNYGNHILVKVSGDPAKSIAAIEKRWKATISHRPFEYKFLDDNYNAMYKSESILGKALNTFTIIAVVLACLGLYGLSAYTIRQRFKEISIRRVLGASVSGIVQLLSGGFLKLILLAFVIAVPLAWYSMSKWLDDYVYRIDIGLMVFVIAGSLALLIAFTTVSLQAIKAALHNPVKNLRTE